MRLNHVEAVHLWRVQLSSVHGVILHISDRVTSMPAMQVGVLQALADRGQPTRQAACAHRSFCKAYGEVSRLAASAHPQPLTALSKVESKVEIAVRVP